MAQPLSLNDVLAAFLTARAGRWIDGERLSHVAGKYAWRSRLSDLRRAPYGMTIENRQRTLTSGSGKRYKVSEYRLVTPCNGSVTHTSVTV